MRFIKIFNQIFLILLSTLNMNSFKEMLTDALNKGYFNGAAFPNKKYIITLDILKTIKAKDILSLFCLPGSLYCLFKLDDYLESQITFEEIPIDMNRYNKFEIEIIPHIKSDFKQHRYILLFIKLILDYYNQITGYDNCGYVFTVKFDCYDYQPKRFEDEFNSGLKEMDILNKKDLRCFARLFELEVPRRKYDNTGLLEYLNE